MSDTLPTATRVSDPGIRALYRLENRWQAWLDVEAALAKAQAELGIIPNEAAEAIARAARLELLDRARIDEGFARTGHTIVPLVWELGRVVGEPHGGWVHWGATTQNITQTGDLLVLRQAHGVFLRPDRRGAGGDGRSRRARRRDADRRAARMASTRCRRPSATRWRCGSTSCSAMSSGCSRRRRGCSSRCWAAAPAPSPRSASKGRRCRPASASTRHGLDAGAVAHARRPSGREHLSPRHAGGDLRQDRPRDLHADEDRVRRGGGAGAARHRRQLDDAAKAQSQAVPGHHRAGGRGAHAACRWRWRRCRPSTRPTAPPA